ncbi:hypothetical protein A2U01_0102882, partial [Trifolium medium]|nr:hypothetical protein [Trifolium medium]
MTSAVAKLRQAKNAKKKGLPRGKSPQHLL